MSVSRDRRLCLGERTVTWVRNCSMSDLLTFSHVALNTRKSPAHRAISIVSHASRPALCNASFAARQFLSVPVAASIDSNTQVPQNVFTNLAMSRFGRRPLCLLCWVITPVGHLHFLYSQLVMGCTRRSRFVSAHTILYQEYTDELLVQPAVPTAVRCCVPKCVLCTYAAFGIALYLQRFGTLTHLYVKLRMTPWYTLCLEPHDLNWYTLSRECQEGLFTPAVAFSYSR